MGGSEGVRWAAGGGLNPLLGLFGLAVSPKKSVNPEHKIQA